MGAICVLASSYHFIEYSMYYFFSLLQNVGLKHGKALVQYIVSYFHDIMFQMDHVWTIRGPCFANLKEKRGLKDC